MPNHVRPVDVLEAAINVGVMKTHLPFLDQVIRGLYAGFFVAFTTSFNYQLTALTGSPVLGAMLFFLGFVMILFYGLDLVTGNFLLVPLALYARRTSWRLALKNVLTIYVSNFLGCLLYMAFFYGSFTHFGLIPGSDVKSAPVIFSAATSKTVDYYKDGGLGWAACFCKAILCNIMVAFGVLGSLVSTSTTGKVVSCAVPIVLFATMAYEHIVVNMYTISCSMALGSGISQGLWWGWSLAPTTLGNFFGAVGLVATPFWFTHGHEYRQKQREAKHVNDKVSSASDTAVDIEDAASPTTEFYEGSFESAPEEDLYDAYNAAPNTPIPQP